jgi:threonine dehydratase
MISRTDIEQANARIKGHVRRTPVIEADGFGTPDPLLLKLEYMQYTGSFKPRGAFNAMLSAPAIPEVGVVAVSGGNHGAAVGYVATALGAASRIFAPSYSSAVKIGRMRGFGATVETLPTVAEAFAAADAYHKEKGALYLHPYDQVEIVTGQGTVGLELEEDAPDIDTVVVSVGGGGLVGGIAAWYGGKVRVVAVESEGTPTMATAFREGVDARTVPSGIAADALGGPYVGKAAFEIAKQYFEPPILVPDEAIFAAQRLLWDNLRIVLEPGGVTALSALTSGAYQPKRGERVAVVLCGANADPAWFAT